MTSCVHLPGVLVLWLAVRSTGEMTSYLPGLLVRWLAFYLPGVLVRWLTIYLLYMEYWWDDYLSTWSTGEMTSYLPGVLVRWLDISLGRRVVTCRRRGRWRGAVVWSPWCVWAAAGSPAGTSAAAGSARGTQPGPPRRDSAPASDHLNITDTIFIKGKT